MNPASEQFVRATRDWGTKLLDLLFPSRCVNCSRVGQALCVTCAATIQPIASPTCARCGNSLPFPNSVCPECQAHPGTINQLQSVYWHEGTIRRAIHALKYEKRRDLAPVLSRSLAAKLDRADLKIDLVTAVPLHPTRELERGYNQSDLLAIGTANARQMPFARALKRTRATRDQVGLDPASRRINVAGAFLADPQLVAGRNVLLVDDVATTGATLDACAVALFQAEARAVYGLTVTRPRSGT